MNFLMIPFFALFGALLVDERGDVRHKVRGQSYVLRQAEASARRAGTPLIKVPVDPQMYGALRLVAALRIKSQESLDLADELSRATAGADPAARAKVTHLIGVLTERDALLEEQENTIRSVALTLGRQHRLEQRTF